MICRELTLISNTHKDFCQAFGQVLITPLWILNGGQAATFNGTGRADSLMSESFLRTFKNTIVKTVMIVFTLLCLPLVALGLLLVHYSTTHRQAYNADDARIASRLKNWLRSEAGDMSVYEAAADKIFKCYLREEHVLDLRRVPQGNSSVLQTLGNSLWSVASRPEGLRSLPSVIGDITYLEVLHLENNQLTSLPETDLASLQWLREIHVNGNPLSIEHINNVASLLARPNDEPSLTIYFNIPASSGAGNLLQELVTNIFNWGLHEPPTRMLSALLGASAEPPILQPAPASNTLADLIRFWTQLSGSEYNIGTLITALNLGASTSSNHELVRDYLQRLRETKDFQDPAIRETLAKNIMTVLKQASTNAEFKDDFLALIHEALTTCMDRVAHGFNQIMCAYYLSIAPKTHEGRARAVLGAVRLRLVDAFAERKISSIGGAIDPIEVHLALQICLKDALKLPIGVQTMHYARISRVTETDVAHAKAEVLAKTTTREGVITALVSHEAWTKWLDKVSPQRYNTIRTDFAERLEALSTENDVVYMENMGRIERERTVALTKAYTEETRAWVMSNPSILTL